jgi:hypothetical protein
VFLKLFIQKGLIEMKKKTQIKINEDTIKEIIRKTIKEHVGIENALKRGVWSSDDPEDAADMKRVEDDDRRQAEWFGYKDPGNEMSDLMFKRANGDDSELPRRSGFGLGRNNDERMHELYGDEEEESRAYDENPEGEENLYFGDPDLEQDDEDGMTGINEIRLNEENFRKFVSYSVARILKESYYGRPIFDRHGEYDGSEAGSYGENSYVFEPDIEKYIDSEDFEDVPFPQVKVYFTKTEGMKGDGYLQPDDPDEYELESWKLLDKEKYPREIVDAVERYMENDFDLEDSVASNLFEGKNLGVTFHSNGES